MQVEDVTRVCLTSWWSANDQRDVAVCFGVFRQVIIDDQRVSPRLHELLTHGTACVRSEGFQTSRLSGSRHHNDGMLHRAILLQTSLRALYRGVLVTYFLHQT